MPDGTPDHLDPSDINEEIRSTLRHGARAARLVTFSPQLVDLLTPPRGEDGEDGDSLFRRAWEAEQMIRQGIEGVGGPEGAALSIILGLETKGHRSLEERRRAAAQRLGIQPDTLRRNNHEGVLLLELAMQIFTLLHNERTPPNQVN